MGLVWDPKQGWLACCQQQLRQHCQADDHLAIGGIEFEVLAQAFHPCSRQANRQLLRQSWQVLRCEHSTQMFCLQPDLAAGCQLKRQQATFLRLAQSRQRHAGHQLRASDKLRLQPTGQDSSACTAQLHRACIQHPAPCCLASAAQRVTFWANAIPLGILVLGIQSISLVRLGDLQQRHTGSCSMPTGSMLAAGLATCVQMSPLCRADDAAMHDCEQTVPALRTRGPYDLWRPEVRPCLHCWWPPGGQQQGSCAALQGATQETGLGPRPPPAHLCITVPDVYGSVVRCPAAASAATKAGQAPPAGTERERFGGHIMELATCQGCLNADLD